MTLYKVTNGSIITEFTTEAAADAYALANGGEVSSFEREEYEMPQKEKDFIRFKKRAKARSEILATIAAENMERVRDEVWTVAELISLTSDPELKNLQDDLTSLSYEIAASKIPAITNPLITSDIKDSWIALLTAHFYLD